MPAPHDLDPGAMTEEERLDKRRYQANFAFRLENTPTPRSRVLEFQYGTVENG